MIYNFYRLIPRSGLIRIIINCEKTGEVYSFISTVHIYKKFSKKYMNHLISRGPNALSNFCYTYTILTMMLKNRFGSDIELITLGKLLYEGKEG